MAAPKAVTWDISKEPHTKAKLEILRRYMLAWSAIIGTRFPELIYIDGFAGPGMYEKGEDGSPLIALKSMIGRTPPLSSTVHAFFVEGDRDRAEILERHIANLNLPSTVRTQVYKGERFDTAIDDIMHQFRDYRAVPPIFAFVDPFGWTGIDFENIKRILSHESSEVLINFMYEEINRFISLPAQEENFTKLFGSDEWKKHISIDGPRMRNRFFHDLYVKQLRDLGRARYVRSFEMRNDRDVTDYFLFYATHNLLGLRKMKEAMWKVDATGEFAFSDATDQKQMVLFAAQPPLGQVLERISDRFHGKDATVQEVEIFVLTETPFRETHYKKPLKTLESERKLVILNPPASRRIGTFPDPHQVLRFI